MKKSGRRNWMFKVLCFSLCMAGCGSLEPEKRNYPLALAWDYQEGVYGLHYAMADLSRVTKQDKGENASVETLTLVGRDLEELSGQYVSTQPYALDLGHVQAVIFSWDLVEEMQAYQTVIDGMQQDFVLGKNAYVFGTDDTQEIVAKSADMENSLGEYLVGLYENHPSSKEKGVTLEDLYYDWNNTKTIPKIPELVLENGEVVLCEKE